jgi:threonine synthase
VRYVSTRGGSPPVRFSEAMLQGLCPDGGLYVPERFPRIDPRTVERESEPAAAMAAFLRPFVGDDPLADDLDDVCRRAFDFPIPAVPIGRDTEVLELFHGPTAAFKDVGARFLAECFEKLASLAAEAPRLTILVATSGDTGAAVASACHRRRGMRVAVLFPDGGVSRRQERQLTCWDDNVSSFAVRGTFDDCQRVVKQAFRDPRWRAAGPLSSANSINVGRLLPQAAYYAVAAVRHRAAHGTEAGFVVPSGNVGNAVGAFWARAAGFPIRHVALATNANRVVADWFEGGAWAPRPSVRTLANAMDVGDPSNMERLFHLHPDPAQLRSIASAASVDDATIRSTIAEGPARWGRVWDPHTATAIRVREGLPAGPWIVVATAHPAKFDDVVEPLVGRMVEVPPALAELLARPQRFERIEPDLAALEARFGLGG